MSFVAAAVAGAVAYLADDSAAQSERLALFCLFGGVLLQSDAGSI